MEKAGLFVIHSLKKAWPSGPFGLTGTGGAATI